MSLEAEQYIIGGILVNPQVLATVTEQLKPDDFYAPKHQMIFRAMLKIAENGAGIDLVTVPNELRTTGELEDIGIKYIFDLTDSVATTINIKDHINIVLAASLKRQLTDECRITASKAEQLDSDPRTLFNNINQNIFKIFHRQKSEQIAVSADLIGPSFDKLNDIRYGNTPPGLMSGYGDLDDKVMGFQPGNLIIVASRPSVGKTSMGLNFIENITIKEKIPTLLFSLEMTRDQIMHRLMCTRAKVSLHKIMSKQSTDDDWKAISAACNDVGEAPLYIDGSASLSIGNVRLKAQQIKDRENIQLIIVDYLQLISGVKSESRRVEIGSVSNGLLAMARDLDIPIIAMCQLNRQVEQNKDAKPRLADLRESGDIEQDAHIVILIHRKNNNGVLSSEAEVHVAKNRNGPTDIVHMTFLKDITRFEQAVFEREDRADRWDDFNG